MIRQCVVVDMNRNILGLLLVNENQFFCLCKINANRLYVLLFTETQGKTLQIIQTKL